MRKDQSEVVVHGFLRGVDGVYDDVAALVLAYYHSWLQIGDEIDARDKAGKWYSAIITAQKLKGQPLIDAHSDGMNWPKSEIPDELEAVYVHYTAYETKWDQWIVVDPSRTGTICRCPGPCQTSKDGPFTHRLALCGTQRRIQKNKNDADESVCGRPIIAGGVGLVNIDEMSLVNSVVQCMAHCPPLRQFFESGEWWRDLNITNPLGTIVFEMAKLLRDLWSAGYRVIAPHSLHCVLTKCASKFGGWKQRDAMVFVNFLLQTLHEDLNRGQQGRVDPLVSSKMAELFHAQQWIRTTCLGCGQRTPAFETYAHLSLPLVDESALSLVVDVFHLSITRQDSIRPNLSRRHVFHVKKYNTVRELAALIAKKYRTYEKTDVRLYEGTDGRVTGELDKNLILEMVATRKKIILCYIVKDWMAIPAEIKQKEVSLVLCELYHSAPTTKKSFGLPLVVSFLNIYSAREVHQTVYRRLHAWIGTTGKVLAVPPGFRDDEPSFDHEERWNALLASDALPYRLCYVTSHSVGVESAIMHSQLPSDDGEAPLPSEIRDRKEISLRVEWNDSAFAALRGVMDNVVCSREYSKWKKAKQNRGKFNRLNLSNCLNLYASEKLLDNKCYCSGCKKHQPVTKKFDLWSLPELLIIHLNRFGSDGGEKSSTLVDCPIRGLELTAHLINSGDESQSSAFVYDLFAVSCHSDGSLGEGCHTSYALNAETKQWLYFNGSSVQFAKQRDIISQATHVLFYKKRH